MTTDTKLLAIGLMERIARTRYEHQQEHASRPGWDCSYQHADEVIFDRAMREASADPGEVGDLGHVLLDWLLGLYDDPTDVVYHLTQLLGPLLGESARQSQPCLHPDDHGDPHPGDCWSCVLEHLGALRGKYLAGTDEPPF